jgi:O-acetyl-ADP-ribose deacetylase
MPTKIQFVQGDLTDQAVDAIVCDADTELTLDGELPAAILRKGGERIRQDCERLAPITLGEAAVTAAGSLRAFYVVHAAVRRPQEHAARDSVRLAAHHALLRVEEKAFKTVAFSALGTGAAGLSAEASAEVTIQEALNHLKSRSSMENLYFVLPDESTLQIFEAAYQRLTGRTP